MDSLITVINNPWFFASLAGLFGLYLLTLSAVLAIWTARDIKERTRSGFARLGTPLFVFCFGLAGFLPYLAVRPRKTFEERTQEQQELLLLAHAGRGFVCPQCRAPISDEFAFCPHCKAEFRPVCSCGATLEPHWKRCAYCGTTAVASAGKRYLKPISVLPTPAPIKVAVQPQATISVQSQPVVAKSPATTPAPVQAAVPVVPTKKSVQREHERIPALGKLSVSLRNLLAIKK